MYVWINKCLWVLNIDKYFVLLVGLCKGKCILRVIGIKIIVYKKVAFI